ncbi:MAG: hypothetical protein ACI4M3_00165, partial [Acutalibacteraceae bacterium]
MDKSKKKLLIIIIVILTIMALVVGGIVVYNSFFAKKPTDSSGVVGTISDGWETGIKEENSQQKKGVQIPGYSTAVMNSGDKSLHLSIGNPKANECGFYATLKLDDGTVLYKSELLKPGYGLTEVPLSQTLEKGEYTAMVVYQCVTLDEKETPLNAAES